MKMWAGRLRAAGPGTPSARSASHRRTSGFAPIPTSSRAACASGVIIAIALLHEPDLIIADEPTTALDVTIQGQILHEAQKLVREHDTALIWITHDLSVIAGLADRVCVMYAGRVVESGPVGETLTRPLHPYARGLLRSVTAHARRGEPLAQIPGIAPSLIDLPPGCAFRERCPRARPACAADPEPLPVPPDRSVRCFFPHLEPEASG